MLNRPKKSRVMAVAVGCMEYTIAASPCSPCSDKDHEKSFVYCLPCTNIVNVTMPAFIISEGVTAIVAVVDVVPLLLNDTLIPVGNADIFEIVAVTCVAPL